MAKLRKMKVRWAASPSPGVVGYKLYWTLSEGVNYGSASASVGNVTEVILPDDVPSFPLIADVIEMGVTAVDETGNESIMTKCTAAFNFVAPAPPTNVVVENVQDWDGCDIGEVDLAELAKIYF